MTAGAGSLAAIKQLVCHDTIDPSGCWHDLGRVGGHGWAVTAAWP